MFQLIRRKQMAYRGVGCLCRYITYIADICWPCNDGSSLQVSTTHATQESQIQTAQPQNTLYFFL